MAIPHYPAFLDLRSRRVLIVGGGAVALKKARSLRRCGARVVAVAPVLAGGLREACERVHARAFRPSDLRDAWLVVAATSDEALNARVARLCRRRKVFANVVDRPALCGFIAPSIARRGRLTVAVSTGGASPALARAVRRRLQESLRPEDARLAARLQRLRPRLLRLDLARRRKALAAMIGARA